jgi:hypothetical protein
MESARLSFVSAQNALAIFHCSPSSHLCAFFCVGGSFAPEQRTKDVYIGA